MERISKKDYYLKLASAVAFRSTCLKRQYGCVIINRDEVVSTGYNGSPRGESNCCDLGYCERLNEPNNTGIYDTCKAVHAEQNAMLSASRNEMLGGVLYLYGWEDNEPILDCEPCPICRRMLKNAGIISVVTMNREMAV